MKNINYLLLPIEDVSYIDACE